MVNLLLLQNKERPLLSSNSQRFLVKQLHLSREQQQPPPLQLTHVPLGYLKEHLNTKKNSSLLHQDQQVMLQLPGGISKQMRKLELGNLRAFKIGMKRERRMEDGVEIEVGDGGEVEEDLEEETEVTVGEEEIEVATEVTEEVIGEEVTESMKTGGMIGVASMMIGETGHVEGTEAEVRMELEVVIGAVEELRVAGVALEAVVRTDTVIRQRIPLKLDSYRSMLIISEHHD